MKPQVIKPGQLSILQLVPHYWGHQSIALHKDARSDVEKAEQTVSDAVQKNIVTYGVNTGFGKLATQIIPPKKLLELQKNLILSHSCGIGELLPEGVVRLIFLLKMNTLAQGYSGVRWQVIDMLEKLYNAGVLPCVPAKGSVGASGDLAPLAHFSCPLIGEGEVFYEGKIMPSLKALQKVGLAPLQLAPKEGLALLNGTQVSTALLLANLIKCQNLFEAAILAGALSFEAVQGDHEAFDARIHALRRMRGQSEVAALLRTLINIPSRQSESIRVQDPYSLRCQPQVLGACLEQCRYVASILTCEINAVTDNPLVFPQSGEILSGGNFHAQNLALGSDALATAIATIANIAERRIALLMDSSFSGLPPFLVSESGLNSGFMLAQVTAAALVSENKVLAHPASVDSIPTSANQEDHVSMSTFAAKRCGEMIENANTVVAIELLAATQGLDFKSPALTSYLKNTYEILRKEIPFYEKDRYFHPSIAKAALMLREGEFSLAPEITVNRCAFY